MIDTCPICLSREPRQPVLKLQTAPDVSLLQCSTCHGSSASHMPKDDVLARYYARYYADSELKTTTSNSRYFAHHVMTPMSGLPMTGLLRILDYGGGDGSLAYAIAGELVGRSKDVRIHIDLVDFESPRSSGDGRIVIQGRKDLGETKGGYDVVLASAVLEHVPQVNGVIRALAASVRPGGYFYARTPFMAPLARLVRKIDLGYPAHVHDMGSAFWNRAVRTFDLRADIIISRPSLIETTFLQAPFRTIAAFLMKLPSHLELAIRRPRPMNPLWTLVGGWEVVLRFRV